MTSPLTADQIEWARQRYGAEPGIQLITIYGPELPDTHRLARNTEDIVSRGLTFTRSWFDFAEPGDTDDQPNATLTLSNIDRRVGLGIQEVSGAAIYVSYELVRPSLPDEVIEAHRHLRARVVSVSLTSVTLALSAARLDQETYGWRRVSPSDFRGLWELGGL